MLPKDIRLPHSIRLARSSTYKTQYFLMKYALNGQTLARFGVIISKKIDKRAVKRNRMRRLLHTFIQDNEDLFPKGYDYIFIITALFEECPQNLKENFREYFSGQNR